MRLRPTSLVFTLVVLLASATAAVAQSRPASTPTNSLRFAAADLGRDLFKNAVNIQSPSSEPQIPTTDNRACDGCPRRRVTMAFAQALGVNVMYNLANRLRPGEAVHMRVNWNTWWANLKHGLEWDENPFLVNQIGHPYQGNNYYTAARANGMSFWESTSVAAFGSATWEFFGEVNKPSLNDLINTTLGGIALGEMFHRTGWLIRDTQATGRGRLMQEIAAAVIDPMTGVNRFASGDATRVSEKPETMVPSTLAAYGSMGVLWQGSNTRAVESKGRTFAELDLFYGDLTTGRSRTPYDAFNVRFRFGGGNPVSEARVRGRLLGQPLGADGRYQFTVAQAYDFISNGAYEFGGQGVLLALKRDYALSSRTSMAVTGGAGVTLLGAVDSVAQRGPERDYDYGPGTTFAGEAVFARDDYAFARVAYQGYQLYSVDGARANHVLQWFRADVLIPLRGRLALGVTGEYFYRKTYFQLGGEQRERFPQFRVFFAWRR